MKHAQQAGVKGVQIKLIMHFIEGFILSCGAILQALRPVTENIIDSSNQRSL